MEPGGYPPASVFDGTTSAMVAIEIVTVDLDTPCEIRSSSALHSRDTASSQTRSGVA